MKMVLCSDMNDVNMYSHNTLRNLSTREYFNTLYMNNSFFKDINMQYLICQLNHVNERYFNI